MIDTAILLNFNIYCKALIEGTIFLNRELWCCLWFFDSFPLTHQPCFALSKVSSASLCKCYGKALSWISTMSLSWISSTLITPNSKLSAILCISVINCLIDSSSSWFPLLKQALKSDIFHTLK